MRLRLSEQHWPMGAFFFELKTDGNIDTTPVETCTTASGNPMTPSKKGGLRLPFQQLWYSGND
ncbi:hypothetical protein BWQ95_01445 [Aeromonas hydrophila]|nr:hypothetical protein BWQ95_01445 [Aeromonas hydrophila]